MPRTAYLGNSSRVKFARVNAVDLVERFGEESFDRVYSYWLTPHLNLRGEEIAKRAAENMLAITKACGQLAIGPCSGKGKPHIMHINLAEQERGPEVVQDIVEATQLGSMGSWLQMQLNRLNSLTEILD